MLSNRSPWQPVLTNHSAFAKIKVTTSNLTCSWENLVDYSPTGNETLADYYGYAIKTISSQQKTRVIIYENENPNYSIQRMAKTSR